MYELAKRELGKIRRRRERYLAGRPPVDLTGRTANVVDDGFAAGAKMRAALQVVTNRRPARVVLALPAAPPGHLGKVLQAGIDEVVCLLTPRHFYAVGEHYRDFNLPALATASGPLRRTPRTSSTV